jgi:hypothetical protein
LAQPTTGLGRYPSCLRYGFIKGLIGFQGDFRSECVARKNLQFPGGVPPAQIFIRIRFRKATALSVGYSVG